MAVFNNILNGASGQAGGAGAGYQIERSLRFEGNTTTPYLSKNDYAADSNRQTFTLSLWVKKSATVSNQRLFGLSGTNQFSVMFSGTDQLSFYANLSTGTAGFDSAAKYRDFSAWYHIVLAFDTTASGADKMKVYVNGEEPSFTSISQPADNATFYWGDSTLSHFIGRYSSGSSYFYNGYMADIHYVDGQQLNQYDFGEFDANGVWQPIEYTGTYGTNGFHLDFSDNTSTTTIAEDSSGNGNNFTAYNIVPSVTTYGTQYTLSGSTGQFYNNDPANFGADNLFDSSLTSSCLLKDADSTITFNLNPGIAFNSSFEIYYRNGTSVTTLDVNGVSQTVNNNYSTGSEWMTVTGVTSPVTSISWSGTNANYGPYVYAVRVDGTTIIVDGDPTTTDSLLDSPTNGTQTDTGAGGEVSGNYCTINANHSTATILNGNLDVQVAASGHSNNYGTFGMSSGKWYWEVYRDTFNANTGTIGFHGSASASKKIGATWAGPASNTDQHVFYFNATTSGILYNGQSGASFPISATSTPTLPTNWNTEGGYWMFCVDMDDHKAWIGKDGVWWGWTGSAYTTTGGDPANGLNPTFALNANDTYFPFNGAYDTAAGRYTYKHNFGQRPFAYTAPDGFKALCTANLDDPTILDGSTQMDSVLYTGDGTAGNTITGLNFAPDLVWLKVRATYSYNHELYDTVRGVGERLLSSGPNAEVYNANYLQQFNSDGFQLGSGSGQNTNNALYVSWTWKGGGTAVSNTNGSITSSVSANPSAGFSIVSYTGTNGTGTVGHGLNDSPSMVWVKNRDNNTNWAVAHTGLSSNRCLYLNENYADTTVGFLGLNKSNFTSTTFTVNYSDTNTNVVNASSNKYIAYCWAPVEGYSAFGSLDPSSEPFIYTGFRPKFLLYKLSNTTGPWVIYDTERNPYNVADLYLQANSTATEATLAAWDFLSNGFKIKASFPSGTIVYAAFAEHPFKTARAR